MVLLIFRSWAEPTGWIHLPKWEITRTVLLQSVYGAVLVRKPTRSQNNPLTTTRRTSDGTRTWSNNWEVYQVKYGELSYFHQNWWLEKGMATWHVMGARFRKHTQQYPLRVLVSPSSVKQS